MRTTRYHGIFQCSRGFKKISEKSEFPCAQYRKTCAIITGGSVRLIRCVVWRDYFHQIDRFQFQVEHLTLHSPDFPHRQVKSSGVRRSKMLKVANGL